MEVLVFVVGLCVGSFLNVLIDRLPEGESILVGRSHCDFCKSTLGWFELIPVLSFILQRGRCLRCHKKLSLQYPIIELTTALMFVYLPWTHWIIFSALLVIFVADLKYMIIPDSMVVVGLLSLILQDHLLQKLPVGVGASLFFLTLLLITRGRGMGFGDVKLAFLLGVWLGFPQIVIALYVAFLTGAAVGVTLILTGKKGLKSKIAFGPFLILGAGVAQVFGAFIVKWWQELL